MEQDRRRWPRIARVVGWSFLGLVIALYIGLPVTMAATSVWPSRAEVGPTPAGFQDVELTTADNVKLAAWYAPSKNGAAVILLHGAGGSREHMRRMGRLLVERGYGVLSLDLRGHGDSGGRTNRFGWQGTSDVRAAVDFLAEKDPALRIGAVGSSMGGEVLLGASAACPEIEAIVADGATRRSTEELVALPSERPLVRNFTARVMFLAVGLFTGERPPAPLLGEMRSSQRSEFLLIAAGDEAQEIAFNAYFARMLSGRATVWVAPGVGHTGAYARYPDEYARRISGFLDGRIGR